jgi:hypothetical protein
MLAHQGRGYYVKFFECDDAIDVTIASKKREQIDKQSRAGVVWHGD